MIGPAYIELKMEEVTRFRMTTHPIEFDMYYFLLSFDPVQKRRREPPFLFLRAIPLIAPNNTAAWLCFRARAPIRSASLSAGRLPPRLAAFVFPLAPPRPVAAGSSP